MDKEQKYALLDVCASLTCLFFSGWYASEGDAIKAVLLLVAFVGLMLRAVGGDED